MSENVSKYLSESVKTVAQNSMNSEMASGQIISTEKTVLTILHNPLVIIAIVIVGVIVVSKIIDRRKNK